jgi:hypothetical protein
MTICLWVAIKVRDIRVFSLQFGLTGLVGSTMLSERGNVIGGMRVARVIYFLISSLYV